MENSDTHKRNEDLPHILRLYPKTRRELPDSYRRIYSSHIIRNRQGGTRCTSLSSKLERWMHRQIGRVPGENILEIGAGNLNHLGFECDYSRYDVVEPFQSLLETSKERESVDLVVSDIAAVPSDRRYDKILSVAVLEHLCNLPDMVAQAVQLMTEGGVFCAGVPSEGTVLWRLAWELTTGLEFRLRYGLDYGVLMRYEHVNTAAEIHEVLRFFFRRVARLSFGPSPSFSLYQVFKCSDPA